MNTIAAVLFNTQSNTYIRLYTVEFTHVWWVRVVCTNV